MPKMMCFANHKGGVAKTTSCANIGTALAEMGRKVLLVDWDPQANLSSNFNIEADGNSIYEVACGKVKARDAIIETKEKVDILPSHLDLCGLEVELAIKTVNREKVLAKILAQVAEPYDYVLIDSPPSIGMLTINALAASELVLIPVDASKWGAKSIGTIIRLINDVKEVNPALRIGGVFMTKVDIRRILDRRIIELVKDSLPKNVGMFKTHIRHAITVSESCSRERSIFSHAPNSHGAEDYRKLAKEILKLK